MKECIYMFHLDLESNRLTKTVIQEFQIRPFRNTEFIYSFYTPTSSGGKTLHSMESRKFDTFMHDRIYTFNPDENTALDIIQKALLLRMKKAETSYKSAKRSLDAFNSILEKGGQIEIKET